MEAPPEDLAHDSTGFGTVELRRWRATDADAELCFRLVSESLEHLRPWMAWATADYDLADAQAYLERCEDSWAERSAFQYLIIAARRTGGQRRPDGQDRAGGLEIGYWVHPAATCRGVATATSAALTEAAFALPGIDRVEIHHDQLNFASGRIPEKLGYTHVDTREGRFEPAPSHSGTILVWRTTR